MIDDFPPGGCPENFTEVKEPGPADGASPCLASSTCGFSSYLASSASSSSVAKGDLDFIALGFATPPAAPGLAVEPYPILPELPHLSSPASS